MKVGFIGAGNMGYAMLKGALTVFEDTIVYTDVNKERLEEVKVKLGLDYVDTNQEVVDQSDIIVLAIKPQYMSEVLIKLIIDSPKILISIAPGVTIEHVNALIGGNPKIVRAMPNTPALVGEGMSGICFGDMNFTQEDKDEVLKLFNSFGKSVVLPENLMDVVVPVSGSSPAYVFMFIEAMADAGVLKGLSRDMAYKMAAQSVLGAAKMVLETGDHPGVLKDAVCSPGGTTIEAVRILEQKGLRSSVIEAMDACYEKSQVFKKK